MKLNFDNKIVWMTGATSGIGEQIAYKLANEGAQLILSGRDKNKLEKVASACKSKYHVKTLDFELENFMSIPKIVAPILETYKHIDYLFNVAGIAQREMAVHTDLNVDEKIMKVNYFSAVALTKAILPCMIERKSGHVIVISSLSGKYGVPKLSAYSAAKHALHGFFESLRLEVQQYGIKVSIMIPGFINTAIINKSLKGDGTIYNKNIKVQEEGMSSEECAAKIIKAVIKNRKEAFMGGLEGITLLMYRISPSLFYSFLSSHPIKRLERIKNSLMFFRKKTLN